MSESLSGPGVSNKVNGLNHLTEYTGRVAQKTTIRYTAECNSPGMRLITSAEQDNVTVLTFLWEQADFWFPTFFKLYSYNNFRGAFRFRGGIPSLINVLELPDCFYWLSFVFAVVIFPHTDDLHQSTLHLQSQLSPIGDFEKHPALHSFGG